MHGYDLHRLSADGQKSRRQFVFADSVREQFEHLGYDVSGITRLRDDTLLYAHVSILLRTLFHTEHLKQVRRDSSGSHRAYAVTAHVDCDQGK